MLPRLTRGGIPTGNRSGKKIHAKNWLEEGRVQTGGQIMFAHCQVRGVHRRQELAKNWILFAISWTVESSKIT